MNRQQERTKMTKLLTLLTAACLGVAANTQAAFLLYEGYDYTTGAINWTDIDGGVGFDSAGWTTATAAPTGTIVAPLDFSDYDDLYGSGNAFFQANSGNTETATRGVNVNHSGTLWGSYLYQSTQQGPGSINQRSYFSFDGAARLSANANPTGFESGISVNDADETETTFVPVNNTTYLYIGKWEDTGGSADLDFATLWVLSAANYDAIKGGGITEAELNTTNSGSVTATGSWGGIVDTGNLQLTFRRQDGNIDEVRYGTDLDIVFSAIPEPTTLLLVGAGLAGLLILRGRRKL